MRPPQARPGGTAREMIDRTTCQEATAWKASTGCITSRRLPGPAQENLDFYAGILGMRLVKKSVNQDDPGTYHLFYADAAGHPGTDLTFFPVGAPGAAARRATA